MEKQKDKLSRLNKFHPVIVWSTMIYTLIILCLPTSRVYQKAPLYIIIAIITLQNFIWFFYAEKIKEGKRFFYGRLLTESFLLAALMAFSGLIHSPFYILFIIPIFSSIFVLDKKATVYAVLISAILFTLLLFIHLEGFHIDYNHLYSLFIRLGFLTLVGIMARLIILKKISISR